MFDPYPKVLIMSQKQPIALALNRISGHYTISAVETQPVAPASRAFNRENGSLDSLVLWILPLAATALGTLFLAWFLRSFLCICGPNEVVILSGRKHRTRKGQEIGFRVLSGGRALRIPFLETIKRLDVTTMPVPVEVRNAYSKGGIPLHIQAIANIKISSNPQIVGNAIERFLGHKKSEIVRVARETLEGNLRGVVATLTPEQVNEDRLKFAERIASDIDRDLEKLGLQLDTLKIQNVADNVDYLSSLGRQRIAAIMRDAEVAESDAKSAAESIEAECDERSRVALASDRATVLERENDLRKIKAKLDKQVNTERAVTQAAAKERKAKVEQELQTLRAEQERLRLQADEILPAQARCEAQELQARGQAAHLAENVRAEAQVNELLAQVWQNLGDDASTMFLIQQLEKVLQEAVKVPQRLQLQHVNVIDNGDGRAIASLARVYPQVVKEFLEATEATLGINVSQVLRQANSTNLSAENELVLGAVATEGDRNGSNAPHTLDNP